MTYWQRVAVVTIGAIAFVVALYVIAALVT
jgi:hypothetical protein